ncbi:MAG: chromate efflux transporter [Deltaproteobacteria bacterium]|nr:chromate efflux transporter [Deltaproteobacteria bacterium]
MNKDETIRAPSLWELTRTFLHLGSTAYGGLAMVEPIRRKVVQERGWLSQKDFLDGLALCQLLPGATVVQLATYVGYRLRRTMGALAAAGAFILPAFVLMCGLSALYLEYGELTWVKALSRGFNAVVIALLLQALWRFKEIIRRHWLDPGIALLTLGALWGGASYLLVFLAAGFLRWALGLKWAPEADGLGAVASQERLSQPRHSATRTLAVALALALGVWGLWRLDQRLGLLSLIFLKVGVLAFGGGYAMIPILQWEMVDHLGWLSLRQFLDGILLGFITPGPIIITATFIGFWIKGLAGALVGTVAIFLPPILMIIFLTPLYQRLKEGRGMRLAIQGILSALVGMLVLVTLQLGRASLVDLPSWAIMAGAAVALIALRINLAWVVVTVAGLSLIIF